MKQLRYNERAALTIENFFASGRPPHALLIEGPLGSGKKTAAAIFCQKALCTGSPKPCGSCAHCEKVEKQIHPDILFYTVPQGKKEFPVDLVREIRQRVYTAPNEGERTICIIEKAHTMNTAAQNALLKVLEEPPAWVSFVLLAESRSALMPTILSRVFCISLQVPTVEQCFEALAELAPQAGEEQRRSTAAGARGNIGQALALLDDAQSSKAMDDAAALTQALVFGERYEALTLLSAYERDREGLLHMLSLLGERFSRLARAAYMEHPQVDENMLLRVTPMKALAAVDAIQAASRLVSRNVSIPLLVADMVESIKDVLI